jgi:uncharacterized protein
VLRTNAILPDETYRLEARERANDGTRGDCAASHQKPARMDFQSRDDRDSLKYSDSLPLTDPCTGGQSSIHSCTVRFEWDLAKAAANLRAHRVSFSEAVTVLEDEFGLTREDPDAVEEPRFVTLGLSNLGNLLVVVYAYREPDIIRLISAWKANSRQRVLYEKGRS